MCHQLSAANVLINYGTVSINQSINQSVSGHYSNQSSNPRMVSQPVNQSVNQSINQSISSSFSVLVAKNHDYLTLEDYVYKRAKIKMQYKFIISHSVLISVRVSWQAIKAFAFLAF